MEKNVKINLNLEVKEKLNKSKEIKDLIREIKKLKNSNIKNIIEEKADYFKREKSNLDIFIELSFCVLTANYDAEKALKIEKAIGEGFLIYTEKELSDMLKILGYRYPNIRSKFIVSNRKYYETLKDTLKNFETDNERREWLVKNIKGFGMKEASHFLRNIGYFDVAIVDFHILDLLKKYNLLDDILENNYNIKNKEIQNKGDKKNNKINIVYKNNIERENTKINSNKKNNIKKADEKINEINKNGKTKIRLNKELYQKVESILRKISIVTEIPLGILDLYLWYIETEKIIK